MKGIDEKMSKETDVILSILKLSRAMRRCPPPPPGPRPEGPEGPFGKPGNPPFPPALGRLLACVAENPGVSSRDLCEFLDVRPSSLSEILARAESEGWITRAVSEEDRRMQRVNLSEKGRTLIDAMEEARQKDAERKTACFTEEEKAQFCALCNKLSEHMESLDFSDRPDFPGFGKPPRPDFPEGRPGKPFPPEGGRIRC
jgi:DNA-binding MarR family transcriptional regulator